jgi:protein-tyrosine phosphatase
MKHSFNINNTKIYGSSLVEALKNYYKFDLIISLEPPKLIVPKWRKLLDMLRIKQLPRHIEIEWPDYGIPMLTLGDWNILLGVIKGYKKVLVHCKGGVGRTGTALAILYGLSNECIDPVWHIREIYLGWAIETIRQEEYVYEMCGL